MKTNIIKLEDFPLKKALAAVVGLTRVGEKEIMGKDRTFRVVRARALVAKILVRHYGYSHTRVGNLLGKDHTTITHYVNKEWTKDVPREKYL